MFDYGSFGAGVLVGMFILGLLYLLAARMPEMPGEEFCDCLTKNNIKGFDGVKVEAHNYTVGNSRFTRIDEEKSVQNLVQANSGATVQDAINAATCLIEKIKKADKKLESLKYSDKPAYVQKVLASLIQNDCFLKILQSVDEDLVNKFEDIIFKAIVEAEKECKGLDTHLDPSVKKKDLPSFISMGRR